MSTTTSGNVTWLPAAPPVRTRRTTPPLPSLRAMWRAVVTRRMLAEMDDRMLADIGVSRGDASMEANRRPWDLWPHGHLT